MTQYSGTNQKFVLRNAFSGAKIVIDTKEGAERLMTAMPSWKPES